MYSMRKDIKQKVGLEDLVEYVNLPSTAEVVEVGVYRGESCHVWADNYSTVWAVDPWWDSSNYNPTQILNVQQLNHAIKLSKSFSVDKENMLHVFGPDVEKDFDKMCESYPNIIKLKATSRTAASLFEDNSLDMVYIDGDHSYLSVIEDLSLWSNKIKDDGWIAGHDYNDELYPDVIKAVNDYLGEPDETFVDSSWVLKL